MLLLLQYRLRDFICGIWMIQSSSILQKRWVKIAPHINDTFLLLSAAALVIITAQYPGPAIWINAKMAALLLYIVLGTVALKRGKTKGIRIISWCFALLTISCHLDVYLMPVNDLKQTFSILALLSVNV